MMRNLILLEDEPILRRELAEFLDEHNWPTDAVANIATFRQIYEPTRHSMSIIDLNLPDGDGMSLIRELRSRRHKLGIVVLTARRMLLDKVAALEDGADYYLAKTVDLDELNAILTALSRRMNGMDEEREEPWVLEISARRLTPPNAPAIPLSHQDMLVLHALMNQPKEIVSHLQIIRALGENICDYDQRRLHTQMRRLRRKVEEATKLPLPVNTARNSGYCFWKKTRIAP